MTTEQEKQWREEFKEIIREHAGGEVDFSLNEKGEFQREVLNWAYFPYLKGRKKAQKDFVDYWNRTRQKDRDAALMMHLPLLGEYEDQIEALKKEISQLKEELKRERSAVDFYANPESYIIRNKDEWKKKTIEEDELIRNYKHPNTDWIGSISVGGKLARQTQQQRKVEL